MSNSNLTTSPMSGAMLHLNRLFGTSDEKEIRKLAPDSNPQNPFSEHPVDRLLKNPEGRPLSWAVRDAEENIPFVIARQELKRFDKLADQPREIAELLAQTYKTDNGFTKAERKAAADKLIQSLNTKSVA